MAEAKETVVIEPTPQSHGRAPSKFVRKPVLGAIRLYQKTLSPDHGMFKHRHPYGYCRFYPSCSEYSYRAIDERGLIIGTGLSLVRIVKCNPLSTPRVDMSYQKKQSISKPKGTK